MKIGLVLPALPAYSETFFRNKISGLQQEGHEVILFVNQGEKQTDDLGFRMVVAPQLSGNKVKVFFATLIQILKMLVNWNQSFTLYSLNQKDGIGKTQNLKQVLANQFLLQEKVDWLHFGFGTMALGRENVAAVIGAKMAVSFRGFDYYVYPLKHPDCYKILFQKEVKYHVLSQAMKDGLKAKGLSEENIIKITPAIDIDLFTNSTHKPNAQLQLATISRLHYIKGLEYILEALSNLKASGFNFHFTIVGDGAERERLIFATHQLNLTENVTFAGKLPPAQVKQILNQTDIYLQYSLQEGFCNAVLEAQAMGLLCVVSDAEGLSENVVHNLTGFVVPKQNSKLLFEKLKEVIALPEIDQKAIRDKAVARVRNEFNLGKQQREFLSFYQE